MFYYFYLVPLLLIAIFSFWFGVPAARKHSAILVLIWCLSTAIWFTGFQNETPWLAYILIDATAVWYITKRPTDAVGGTIALLLLAQILGHFAFGIADLAEATNDDSVVFWVKVTDAIAFMQLGALFSGGVRDAGLNLTNWFGNWRRSTNVPSHPASHRGD